MRAIETSSEDIIQALRATHYVSQAANLLNVSAPTIFWRANQDARIKAEVQNQVRRREEQIARLLVEHRGNLRKISEELGLENYAALRYYIARSTRLRELYQSFRERIVDKAEENIFEAVEGGNLQYSWRVLQTLGKDRGYVERREVDAQVMRSVQEQPTAQLVAMLDRAVEEDGMEFEEVVRSLPDNDRRLLSQALRSERVGADGEERRDSEAA